MGNRSEDRAGGIRRLPRNVWAASAASFFMDISSEMVLNLLPLFLSSVLGVQTTFIGLIEGVGEATSSLLRIVSGLLSDRFGSRKWLAVSGYAISAVMKPVFYVANTWLTVAGARWGDRVGKGIRTAPRDALIADSIDKERRGLAFGFHRAADTAGAMLGILGALLAVWLTQGSASHLQAHTFRMIVLISLVPAFVAVLALAVGAREVVLKRSGDPSLSFRRLGRPFGFFLVLVAIFELGNSADAFLVLRAQSLGASVLGILGMLAAFNLVYSVISAPVGALSDRIPRRALIVGGWFAYAALYVGIGVTRVGWSMWLFYLLYGSYYGAAYGTTRAFVADLVPAELRGTAYGAYATVVGVLSLPASLVAGVFWDRFGPASPFLFDGGLAFLAALGLLLWRPPLAKSA
jgi:MFS family permease